MSASREPRPARDPRRPAARSWHGPSTARGRAGRRLVTWHRVRHPHGQDTRPGCETRDPAGTAHLCVDRRRNRLGRRPGIGIRLRVSAPPTASDPARIKSFGSGVETGGEFDVSVQGGNRQNGENRVALTRSSSLTTSPLTRSTPPAVRDAACLLLIDSGEYSPRPASSCRPRTRRGCFPTFRVARTRARARWLRVAQPVPVLGRQAREPGGHAAWPPTSASRRAPPAARSASRPRPRGAVLRSLCRGLTHVKRTVQ